MSDRFTLPAVGRPSAVAFPPVRRIVLDNGLRVWSVTQPAVPIVSIALVLEGGTSADPADRPGLASLVATLAAEAAGSRDAIAMADALARIGSHLEAQAGADTTTLALTTVTRHVGAALDLLADVARRPRLEEGDFARVRDLRISRLRQSSRVASTIADRALAAAVFGGHPYGHGSLGTTRAIESTTIDEARAFWTRKTLPSRAILLVAGDADEAAVEGEARRVFGHWAPGPHASDATPPLPAPKPSPHAAADVLAVHRPGAAQAELRVGHLGPSRRTPDYSALVTLNALLGGQFMSRINRNLREARAITYGARTAFDMRRAGGLFSCDTSVQADSVVVAVEDILREFRDVTGTGAIGDHELEQARASLTRGYVRHFETAPQLLHGLAELATYDLPADTFDRFVPAITDLSMDDITRVARATLLPDQCAVVVVTDMDEHGDALTGLGRNVRPVEVEF